MKQRRPTFFSLPALLVMGVLLALVLFVLFPRQSAFEDLRYLSDPDAVSLAYLETLLKSDPDTFLRQACDSIILLSWNVNKADI